MHELLAAGLEFSNIGMVKIEQDYSILGVNGLLLRLEERGLSNWDVPRSLK